MSASMKEVAKLAGVSIATVSRVLSDNPNVDFELRSNVLEAVEKLGYKYNRVARSLRTQSSQIIGLIISDIQNPFFTSLVRAVEYLAYKHGYGTLLCNSDENTQKEEYCIDLLISEQVAGVVITPTRERSNLSEPLFEAKIPVVAVDRMMVDSAVDTVIIDNVQASRDLVSHLIEDGHRRIAAIVGSREITTGRLRNRGYIEALKAYHLPIDKSLIRMGIPKIDFGYENTKEILSLPNPPTAILAGNNLIALGVLRAIKEQHLRIPEDIAWAAFDDMEWTSLIDPPVTVVKQPIYQLGLTAIDLLLKRINDPNRAIQEVTLHSPLIVRQSCARHATAGEIQ